MEKLEKGTKCICCNIGEIEDWFDICDACGWEHDNLQAIKHDLAGGANNMSLNQARKAYKKGEKIN